MARHFDGDEIAIDSAGGVIARDSQFAAELLLVDRHQPAAAARQAAKDAEHAMLGAVHQLDDAGAGFILAASLDAEERAVADAGDFARPSAARRGDPDDGGRRGRLRPIRSAAPRVRRRCRGR